MVDDKIFVLHLLEYKLLFWGLVAVGGYGIFDQGIKEFKKLVQCIFV